MPLIPGCGLIINIDFNSVMKWKSRPSSGIFEDKMGHVAHDPRRQGSGDSEIGPPEQRGSSAGLGVSDANWRATGIARIEASCMLTSRRPGQYLFQLGLVPNRHVQFALCFR